MIQAKASPAAAACPLPTSPGRMETGAPGCRAPSSPSCLAPPSLTTFLGSFLPLKQRSLVSVIWGDGGSRTALAVSDGSPSTWGQATSPHVCDGHWVSLETPRMGKIHKDLETGTRANNPSWDIQALIMQTTDKHRTGTNLLSINHANTHVLMLLFIRAAIL